MVIIKDIKKEPKLYKKNDFVTLMAKYMNEAKSISKKDEDIATYAFLETLREILVNGDSVNFIGFGRFSIAHREASYRYNASIGITMKVKASNVVKFKVSSKLKDGVNG